jgi:hypothetical protein
MPEEKNRKQSNRCEITMDWESYWPARKAFVKLCPAIHETPADKKKLFFFLTHFFSKKTQKTKLSSKP